MTTHPLRALVLDANSISRGEPNVQLLETWAAACANHDVELWVPEVVAWELAEHVSTTVTSVNEAITTHNRARRKWGVEPLDDPDTVDVQTVVEVIEQAGIVIVPLDGDSAVAAVRDQVLQAGAGSRKKGVKTGAADSAWLRSVYSYNDDSFDGLILVTADVGARNAAREMSEGPAPRIASNLDELRHLLDEEQSGATPEQADKFRTAVQTKIDTPDDLHYLADLGPRNWWSPAALDRDFRSDWEQQETDIASVGAVEIVGPATYDPWSDAVTGRVRVPVTIEEQYARQDASGDAPEYLFVTYNASVEAGVTVYLNTTREADAVLDDEFAVVRLAVDDDSVDRFNF